MRKPNLPNLQKMLTRIDDVQTEVRRQTGDALLLFPLDGFPGRVFAGYAYPGHTAGHEPEKCPSCALGACVRRLVATPDGLHVEHDRAKELS